MKKLTKKIFKRELSLFELYTVLSGISVGLFSIFKGNGNLVPSIFGVSVLILVYYFIKKKRKDIVLLTFISMIGILLFINFSFPLTTVFSPQGFNSIPPQTYQECKDIGGIAFPLNQNCIDSNMIEFGNSGENYICCLPDTCQGEWVRIYNSETKVFEKVCYEKEK